MKTADEFRDPAVPVKIPCPICRCTRGPLGYDQDRESFAKIAETSLRRDGEDGDWEYRILLYARCPRHGDFSVAVSSYGTPNYHDFVAYEAEKKSIIQQICARLEKLAEELRR